MRNNYVPYDQHKINVQIGIGTNLKCIFSIFGYIMNIYVKKVCENP